ncbi:MAG TPA: hypothetical protein VEH31_00210 [Streptosporangiaceae bacterium]|nr:hypothetical protein [Streptosporangiaceae bacterium]
MKARTARWTAQAHYGVGFGPQLLAGHEQVRAAEHGRQRKPGPPSMTGPSLDAYGHRHGHVPAVMEDRRRAACALEDASAHLVMLSHALRSQRTGSDELQQVTDSLQHIVHTLTAIVPIVQRLAGTRQDGGR